MHVIEQPSARCDANVHVVQLGNGIQVDSNLLNEYCFSAPTDLTHDLMAIIGGIRCADRSIRRRYSEGWGRRISLKVPVIDKALWSSKNVVGALTDCLDYLTGDEWRFDFTRRMSRPNQIGQEGHVVTPPPLERVFVPYSHGLDSYAQLKLLQQKEPDVEVVCVFTDAAAHPKSWKQFCRRKSPGGVKPIPVPVTVAEPHHSEPTFRSRSFMYYMLTAYGAVLAKADRVLIPENGQGSLGGSLVPLGTEAKHRSCHPGFTMRLTQLLRHLTGRTVQFEHPGLFQTKGQVMAALTALDSDSDRWLREHWSCSHDQRHSHHDGARVHCGVCGNCLLRRSSELFAGIADVTQYKFSNLQASTLEQAVLGSSAVPKAIKGFRDLAGNSARSMERLAQLARQPDDSRIWSEAAALTCYEGQTVKNTHAQLVGMLQQHEKEWRNFLTACGDHSWVSQLARG